MTSAYILLLAWIPAQESALTYHDDRAREALTAALADMQPRDHLEELRRLREERVPSQPINESPTQPSPSILSPSGHHHEDQGASTGPSSSSSSTKETYPEALARSIREGKPFLVWVGEGICPACIEANKDEFISWVDPDGDFHGFKNGVIVAMPEAGKSIKIAEITDWTSGHIPTVRRAIRRWDESRMTTFHSRDSWRGTDGQGGMNVSASMSSTTWVPSSGSSRITGPTSFRVVTPAPVMRPVIRSRPMSFRSRSSRGCST